MSSACAVELSVWIGVHVYGWPNSSSVVRMETAVFVLMNNAPSSASAADDMTDLIICDMLRMAPLFIGILSSPAMNMCPLAVLINRRRGCGWRGSCCLLCR